MTPHAGLIGLTVFTEYLNCAAALRPIDGGSAKGGVVRAARLFPARGLNPATRTAREALPPLHDASRADPFEQSNHGGGSTAQEQ